MNFTPAGRQNVDLINKVIKVMNRQVGDYIEKQKFPQKEICQKLRRLIFEEFLGIEVVGSISLLSAN